MHLRNNILLLSALFFVGPCVHGALPACPTSCSCTCGFGCLTNHTCILRSRSVVHAPLPGISNRYLITCTFRGGLVADGHATYFCCNHTLHVHDHSGYFSN